MSEPLEIFTVDEARIHRSFSSVKFVACLCREIWSCIWISTAKGIDLTPQFHVNAMVAILLFWLKYKELALLSFLSGTDKAEVPSAVA